MTATLPETAVATDIAARVDDFMVKHWPSSPIGDWLVARDYRDDTGVVVWRRGTDGPVQPQVRGHMLYRWLCSLRDAGFIGEARTDMEVFGRPDERSPIAHWLHITGWQQPELPRPAPKERWPRPQGDHRINALPSDPDIDGISRPTGYRFTYWAPGDFSQPVTFTVLYGDDAEALTVPAPDWLIELAEEHRPCLDNSDPERQEQCTR